MTNNLTSPDQAHTADIEDRNKRRKQEQDRFEARQFIIWIGGAALLALLIGHTVTKASAQAAYDAVNFETNEWRMQ